MNCPKCKGLLGIDDDCIVCNIWIRTNENDIDGETTNIMYEQGRKARNQEVMKLMDGMNFERCRNKDCICQDIMWNELRKKLKELE